MGHKAHDNYEEEKSRVQLLGLLRQMYIYFKWGAKAPVDYHTIINGGRVVGWRAADEAAPHPSPRAYLPSAAEHATTLPPHLTSALTMALPPRLFQPLACSVTAPPRTAPSLRSLGSPPDVLSLEFRPIPYFIASPDCSHAGGRVLSNPRRLM